MTALKIQHTYGVDEYTVQDCAIGAVKGHEYTPTQPVLQSAEHPEGYSQPRRRLKPTCNLSSFHDL